jgi:hypothetical protein
MEKETEIIGVEFERRHTRSYELAPEYDDDYSSYAARALSR